MRYIGADKQGSANDTFKAPNSQLQTMNSSDKSFQFAQSQQQQLGESLKGSLQFQSQTAARMSEDFSRTNQQAVQSASQRLQVESQDDGFGKALNNLTKVGNMIVDTLENRSKLEAAQAKAVRERNAASMWERVAQWEVDAPAKARLDPAGTVRLRGEAAELLSSTEGSDLLPEDREKLMRHVYGNVIGGLASKNVEDLITQQRKLQEVNTNVRKERAILESTSLLSSLSFASTPETQQAALDKLGKFLGAIATSSDLDAMNKAEIQLGLTVQMNKALFSSEENRSKAEKLLLSYNAFQRDVQEARDKYPDDIEAQETAIAASAFLNNIPNDIRDRYDITKAQERANRRVELDNTTRDLRSGQIAREIGVTRDATEAGFDATQYITEADMLTLAEDLGGGDAEVGRKTPYYLQVVAAKKARTEFEKQRGEINVKLAQLRTTKSRIAQGDAQANLEYLRTLKPSPQTSQVIERLKIATGNNPALGALLPLIGQYEQLDKDRKLAFDSAYAQAVAGGFQASNELVQSIDAEASALREQFRAAENEIVRYGFDVDGSFNKDRAVAIEQARQKRQAERRAQMQQQYYNNGGSGSGGGATESAPFSQGGGYFNGLEVLYDNGDLIMPLTKAEVKRQGAPNINSPVGMRNGRMHNGQDLGVDMGTPLVSMMDGVVTRIWGENDKNAGTSGNTIELKFPDGSYHTFMHLQTLPNLALGQRVRAGQVFARQGNTGLRGGNSNTGNTHIHWEVRMGDTLSTPQIWSKKYREWMRNAPKQPRSAGPGSSVSAPVRGSVGVPVKGGVLIPDGKGGGSVASYRGTTMNVQQVKQQYNVPTPTKVDKTKAGQVLVQRTGRKNAQGLEDLVVTVYGKNGLPVGEYLTNSGSPSMQGTFGPANSTVAGSKAPLEFGTYEIGTGVDASDIASMRSDFIPIEPKFNTKRSLLGIHFDGDRDVAPGSAGCIVFPSKTSFNAFHTAIKREGSKTLNFSPKLYDKGQQKSRPSIPAKAPLLSGPITYSVNGTAYQRDQNGNRVRVPDPIGVAPSGVTSKQATYSNANPLRNINNSSRVSDYDINDIRNDHGFTALKKDPVAARTINEVARDFGVPGEWLAEVISIETGNTFSTSIREAGGSGAVGLIQFYPDVRGGSTKTINGRVYNLDTISRMSMVEQLRGPVKDYLREAMTANNMKRIPTIQDLYALVWAYGPASKARRMRDEHGPSGTEILNRLGKFSGRRYSSNTNTSVNIAQADTHKSHRTAKLTQRVDTRPSAGCTTCAQMMASNMFIPHERVNLNKGMELFNYA